MLVKTETKSVSPKDITFKTLKIRECDKEEDKFKARKKALNLVKSSAKASMKKKGK